MDNNIIKKAMQNKFKKVENAKYNNKDLYIIRGDFLICAYKGKSYDYECRFAVLDCMHFEDDDYAQARIDENSNEIMEGEFCLSKDSFCFDHLELFSDYVDINIVEDSNLIFTKLREIFKELQNENCK